MTKGLSGEDPRERHPKREAHRAEAPGGSGSRREPGPEAGGAPKRAVLARSPRWARAKCEPTGRCWLWGLRTWEGPREVCIFW